MTRASTVAAVPLVLSHVGDDIYAAWVMAGTLVMAQGLVDFGVASATIRYVAVSAAQGSRRAVIGALRSSAVFYAGLSILVSGLLFGLAHELVGLVPFLRDGADRTDATALVRYAAVAFVLTNAVLLLSAFVQGLGRVDAAFRGQTLGWLTFVPVLAAGLVADGSVDALGLSWLIAYGLQLVLLAFEARRALAGLAAGDDGAPAPRLRDLVSLGARWQVSAYADFATFQVPRLLAGVTLTSAEVVALDLAMRGAQLAVSPFFAVYPLVLPAAASVSVREGEEGIGERLSRWAPALAAAVVMTAAVATPLLPPLISVWSGVALADIDRTMCALVLVGVLAHAATGPLTSALLAIGEVGAIIQYKLAQLLLAITLLAVASLSGVVALAAALAVALTLPAGVFLRRTCGRFGSIGTRLKEIAWPRLLAAACACALVPLLVSLALSQADALAVLLATLAALLPVLVIATVVIRPRRLLPGTARASRVRPWQRPA